jgi:hypothetical protein
MCELYGENAKYGRFVGFFSEVQCCTLHQVVMRCILAVNVACCDVLCLTRVAFRRYAYTLCLFGLALFSLYYRQLSLPEFECRLYLRAIARLYARRV